LLSLISAVSVLGGASPTALAESLRFFGNGVNDIDRVKIRIDNPGDNNPGPPADIGSTDFTIEFWLRSLPSDNPAPQVSCGTNINWINGNIVFDRDRYNQTRAFGISLGGGRVVFGTRTTSDRTICGTTDLRNGLWHHVAVQRQRSNGALTLYVDGVLDASGDTPDNEDISYPDNGVPGNFCGGPCTNSDPFIVLGAEKHDAGPQYPSFSGWVDELRLSTVLRYAGNFTPPQIAFTADANTAALYHFDEGNGTGLQDFANGSASPGVLNVGGTPSGPQWSTETPFGASGAAGTIELAAASYAVAETSAQVTITATRVAGTSGAVTVDYTTNAGTAIPGADYTGSSGTLSWNDGDAAPKPFNVPVIDDAAAEGDETFVSSLGNVSGGATLGSRSSATVTIQDDEAAGSPGTFAFGSSNYSVNEGGTLTAVVRRVGGSAGIAAVSYATADGSATSGADYTSASNTLTWGDGDTVDKTLQITITNDTVQEPLESFSLGLTGPTGGATLASPSIAQVAINDDDAAYGGGGGGGGGGSLDWLTLLGLVLLAGFRRAAGKL
jgi:hypothetical protein